MLNRDEEVEKIIRAKEDGYKPSVLSELLSALLQAYFDLHTCYDTAEAADPLPVAKWMRENATRGMDHIKPILDQHGIKCR